MAKYLIDANLPYYFSLWNNPDFLHLKDIDDTLSDDKIWNFARDNNLIIITKDADFSLRVLRKGTPPKVIHLKFGNLKMKEFHSLIIRNWSFIESRISDCNLINVYLDRIEFVK